MLDDFWRRSCEQPMIAVYLTVAALVTANAQEHSSAAACGTVGLGLLLPVIHRTRYDNRSTAQQPPAAPLLLLRTARSVAARVPGGVPAGGCVACPPALARQR